MELLIIGIDGATWEVIDPLLDQGRLPNMARLINGGARATLRSFEPSLTPILWTDIATGKMPEKHGVTRYFHTANNLRVKRLWDILERPDRTVGLWSWPVTWPPRPINGFIVPSLFARTDDTYPSDLRFVKELEKGMNQGWSDRVRLISKATRYGLRPAEVAKIAQYAVNGRLGKYNALDRHVKQRLLKLDIHLDIYTYLVRKYEPYFTAFYLNLTDAVSHLFWRYYQPHLFPDVSPEDAQKYGDVIPNAYEKTDQAIGQLLQLTDDSTLVVVISDHGFQAELNRNDEFYGRVLGDKLLEALDLDHDVSYVNYRRFVVLELPERRPDIVERLHQLQVQELDKPLLGVDEDLDGRLTLKLFANRDYGKCSLEDLNSLHVVWPGGKKPFLELIQPHYNKRQSGVHHPDGIGIFYGPGVQPGGHITNGSIIDMVPTVLALLGVAVGRDMDGKVLTQAIVPEFLAKRPITYTDTYDTDLDLSVGIEEEPVSPELLNRLRELGYIE